MGDVVNLENDCVGKYVERLLACSPELAGETVRQSASAVSPYVEKANGAASQKQGGITKEFLLSNGWAPIAKQDNRFPHCGVGGMRG